MSTALMLISGTIRIPRTMTERVAKAVRIRLFDTSKADAPSELLAEYVIQDVMVSAGSGAALIQFKFEPELPESLETTACNLSVHVDWAGNNSYESGDLITTQSYPIECKTGSQDVTIDVSKI